MSNSPNLWRLIPTISTATIAATLILTAVSAVVSLRSADTAATATSLDIVAHLVKIDAASWQLRGRVLRDGAPVRNANIWAILSDDQGNRDSPPAAKTDALGEFAIDSVPMKIANNKVTEATVHILLVGAGEEETREAAQVIIRPAGEGSIRKVDLPVSMLTFIAFPFLASLVFAFAGWIPKSWKYGLSIFFATLLTFSMIAGIAIGLRYVNSLGREIDILSLGFATLFRGTYVEAVPSEWLISLTERPGLSADASDAGVLLVRGFGAPLWVLLVSVIGAGLLTVSIILKEIGDRPDMNVAKEIHKRIEMIVRHQFFILFAPLGAIFVYQTLILAEAAENPFTVALAALGAGASLNALLNRAIAFARRQLEAPEA